MKQRFRIWRRDKHARGGSGVYYLEDTETGKRTSLQTTDRQTAERLLNARREAEQQPQINLQIARTYLLASDPTMVTRTWNTVIQAIVDTKVGETQRRWNVAASPPSTCPDVLCLRLKNGPGGYVTVSPTAHCLECCWPSRLSSSW